MKTFFLLILSLVLLTTGTSAQSWQNVNQKVRFHFDKERPLNNFSTATPVKHLHPIFKMDVSERYLNGLKSSGELKQRLDSLIWQGWDGGLGQWKVYDKEEFVYNTANQNTLYIDSGWDDNAGAWVPYVKYEYVYDAAGDMIQETEWYFDDGSSQWIANYRYEHTYNASHNITITIISYWDESVTAWVPQFKEESSYSTGGRLTLKNTYEWDSGSGQWMNYLKTEYSYNSNGFLSMELEYVWDSGIWFFYDKIEYTYDVNDFLIRAVDYYYDYFSIAWIPLSKEEYAYDDAENLLKQTSYDWDENENQWVGRYQDTYTHNNMYSFFDLILPYIAGTIETSFLKHMVTNIDEETWDEILGAWVNSDKGTFYYSPQNVTSSSNTLLQTCHIYPNPAKDHISIALPEGYQKASFELSDQQGRIIYKENVVNNQRIDITKLSSGLYLFNLLIDGRSNTGKLVKHY